MFMDANTSTSLWTTLAADAHLAEGQCLLDTEQCKVSDMPSRNSENKNLSKKENIEAMSPHTKSLQL
jgi:hypothetical protein